MANTEYSGEQYRGTVVAADVRYGSTFLNVERVLESVPGEIVKDPITGELFTRRAIDGKIISFAQRSITVYDFLSEYNLQLQSSLRFKYPDTPGSYLIGTWFDVNTMLTHRLGDTINIYEQSLVFPSADVNPGNVFAFKVSTGTNGIFIKASTRHGDRNPIAYLTGKFSVDESIGFSGTLKTFGDWLTMHLDYQSAALYDTWKRLPGWKSSNIIVETSIIVGGQDESNRPVSNTIEKTYALRLGEAGYIEFPANYTNGIATVTSVIVRINKIHMPKICYEYFLMTTNVNTHNGIASPLLELIEADLMACIRTVECYYFISEVNQLPFGDNRTVHQLVDQSFFKLAIDKLLTASGTRSAQSSALQPTVWGLDSIWMEETRMVLPGNIVRPTGSLSDFKSLEEEMYNPAGEVGVSFTKNSFDGNNMFVKAN